MQHELDSLKRPTRQQDQLSLFDGDFDWKAHWWGMPEFTTGDATPRYRITVNFMTLEDVIEFGKRIGVKLGPQSDTAWFPQQRVDEPKEWAYVED